MSMQSTQHHLVPVPAWGPRVGNDAAALEIAYGEGSGFVEFDLPGVTMGTAEYDEGPTGVTVIGFDRAMRTSVDARGGAIGIIGRYERLNDALCFAGGSSYGLAATTGVTEQMLAEAPGRANWAELPGAAGAVIYDYAARATAIAPDAALGAAAYRARRADRVAVGRVGAGMSASSGKVALERCEYTGQGVAFRAIGDIRILVLTVPNPLGVIVDRDGTVVRGNYDAATGTRSTLLEAYEQALGGATPAGAKAGNTTLTAVVTNVRMPDKELRLFGRQVHSSMHRGIQPFHTNQDGDTLFAVTTDEIDLPADYASPWGENSVNVTALATVASEVAWDALLAAVR